jgi:acyl-CoA thioester hydrolase
VECDQQGIVFNAHYLVWADEAVNTWWADLGVRWSELYELGVEYVVVASALEWRSSARYGDVVEVDAELERLGRTSLTVRFAIRVGTRVCCEVRTTYVCTAAGTPTPWPDDVRALLSAG